MAARQAYQDTRGGKPVFPKQCEMKRCSLRFEGFQENRAISLLEMVIALFVLLTVFTIVTTLFLQSSRHLVNVERKVLGVVFAELVLDDAKDWASDYDNFSGNWSTWASVTDPAYPGFEGRLTVRKPQVFNPCTDLEVGKPPPLRVAMTESFRDLTIDVFHSGARQFSLSTRITEPPREVKGVTVDTLGLTNLPANMQADFRGVVLDTSDRPIADMGFRWSVEPQGGNGTAAHQEPDTSLGLLRNEFVGADGVARIVSGTCKLKAVSRYRGRQYFGLSESVTLLP